MKKFIKDNIKVLIFFAIIGFIGGIFTGKYTLDNISEDMLKQVIDSIGSKENLISSGLIPRCLHRNKNRGTIKL